MSKCLEDLSRTEGITSGTSGSDWWSGGAARSPWVVVDKKWLISNGHDPEDYLFIEAKFESFQTSMKLLETVEHWQFSRCQGCRIRNCRQGGILLMGVESKLLDSNEPIDHSKSLTSEVRIEWNYWRPPGCRWRWSIRDSADGEGRSFVGRACWRRSRAGQQRLLGGCTLVVRVCWGGGWHEGIDLVTSTEWRWNHLFVSVCSGRL